jgi:hypothetical protein
MINMIMHPQCLCCKHSRNFIIENSANEDSSVHRCYAFPEGIPDDIFNSKFNHRFEYPGDKGIRFEAQDEFTDAMQAGNFIFDESLINVKLSKDYVMELMRKKHEERYGKS